jgi:hypothetical protein
MRMRRFTWQSNVGECNPGEHPVAPGTQQRSRTSVSLLAPICAAA